MEIHDKFRERFAEQQEKNRSETEDLFLEILSGIGEQIKNARSVILSATEHRGNERDKMIREACKILRELEEELL